MDFALFVALNAVLLIRPEELIPGGAGLRLYLIVIVGCLLTTGARLLENLRPAELGARPITVCVLGVWAAGVLSLLVRGQVGLAADFAGSFGKVVLYYLLLVSVLNSPSRLRAFLGWIVVFVIVLSTLGLLQYHEVIDVEALRPLERGDSKPDGGEASIVLQLRGTGIYNDPNDLCLILVTGSICALYRVVSAGGFIGRVLWLAPIGLFGYSVTLTQSRGGLIGLLVAACVWASGRFGWKKTLLFVVLLAPAPALLIGGRQANLNLGKEDTAHGRVELWASGLALMWGNPITGIGVGQYSEEVGLVAHNAYVHAYVEMGLVGGSLFVGAFYLGLKGCTRGGRTPHSGMRQIQPIIRAIVIGYMGGVFSISRDYVVPTYLVIGLADAFFRITLPAPPNDFKVSARLMASVFGVGVAVFIGLRLVTAVLLAAGG